MSCGRTADGAFMYPWMLWYSVGTSVDPWMAAWPRSAMMPPPGRPMLPVSWESSAQQLMICTP